MEPNDRESSESEIVHDLSISEVPITVEVSTGMPIQFKPLGSGREILFPIIKRGRPRKYPEEEVQAKKFRAICCCEICGKEFSKKSDLVVHYQEHNEQHQFQCHLCDFKTDTFHSLNYHRKRHRQSKNIHRCKDCDKEFLLKIDLLQHSLTHALENPLICKRCPFTCVSEKEMQTHDASVHEAIRCSYCNDSFITKKELHAHVTKFHGRARGFPCNKCDKGFQTEAALLSHVKAVHEGSGTCIEKEAQCEKCPKIFSCQRNLNKHMKVVHSVRPYVCETCGAKFGVSAGLKDHMKIHSGEKPFSCTVCASKFTRRTSLARHVLQHSGIKNHRCNLCVAEFTRASSLKRHLIMHNLGPREQCSHCDFCCLWPSELLKHTARVHGKNGSKKPRAQKKIETPTVKDKESNEKPETEKGVQNSTVIDKQSNEKPQTQKKIPNLTAVDKHSNKKPQTQKKPQNPAETDKQSNKKPRREEKGPTLDDKRSKNKTQKQVQNPTVDDVPLASIMRQHRPRRNVKSTYMRDNKVTQPKPIEVKLEKNKPLKIAERGTALKKSKIVQSKELKEEEEMYAPSTDAESDAESAARSEESNNSDQYSSDESESDCYIPFEEASDYGIKLEGLQSETKTGPNEHTCDLCDFVCDLPFELSEHLKMHNEQRKYSCKACDIEFMHREEWQDHRNTHHHSTTTAQQVPKKAPRVTLNSTGTFKRKTVWACTQCNNRLFRYRRNYVMHVMRHFGVMPYACDHCELRFGNRLTLKNHMQRLHPNVTEQE